MHCESCRGTGGLFAIISRPSGPSKEWIECPTCRPLSTGSNDSLAERVQKGVRAPFGVAPVEASHEGDESKEGQSGCEGMPPVTKGH